ncbi:MAG: hypothetical protein K2L10_10305 [Ruminococcus sp.]|nr:hypothetical protein [Ruminococcus sp.]
MKKANDLLGEIKSALQSPEKTEENYSPVGHPAKSLDEYMKEQYFMMLFSVLTYSESKDKKTVSYLIGIADSAGFSIVPEEVVKYVYSFNEKKMQDFSVSFRDEEIKYLLGFELYMTANAFSADINKDNYIKEIYGRLEIPLNEYENNSLICQVLKTDSLSAYTKKENYTHSDILECYFYKFDFDKERCLVVSNCIEKVRDADSDHHVLKLIGFMKAHFISPYDVEDFSYVEKNTSLGHFIAMVGGFSLVPLMGNASELMRKIEEDEKRLTTPKFKNYNEFSGMVTGEYYQDNTYEVCDIKAEKSGVFYFIYNGIGVYNDPFSVISHPLDSDKNIIEYLNKHIETSRENNKSE